MCPWASFIFCTPTHKRHQVRKVLPSNKIRSSCMFLSTIGTVWLCQRHFLETLSPKKSHSQQQELIQCSINQFCKSCKNCHQEKKNKGKKKRGKLLSRNGELNTSAVFLTSTEEEKLTGRHPRDFCKLSTQTRKDHVLKRKKYLSLSIWLKWIQGKEKKKH